MQEPRWIDDQFVLAAHAEQLQQHGGIAGTRDAGLLSSALARPRQRWAYGSPRPDLAALAAEYAFGIARNHPFLDGNKRTALVVCRTFLRLNGVDFTASQADQVAAFLALASGEMDADGPAEWMRATLVEHPQ